jgi:aquaporin rerated protein, other eukaryote
MFLTAQLVLTVFMLAVEKHRSTFLAPVGIGLTLFVAEIAGVHYTGGSLNPARSFGPDVVLGSFPSYHWIYCTAPVNPVLTK